MIGITNTVLNSNISQKKKIIPLMPRMTGLTMGNYECLPFASYYNNNVQYSGYKCFDSAEFDDDVVCCHSVNNPTYPLTFGWGCSTKKSKLLSLRLSSQTQNNGLSRFETRMPKKFDVQGSNDKINWTTITTIEETTNYTFKVWDIPN